LQGGIGTHGGGGVPCGGGVRSHCTLSTHPHNTTRLTQYPAKTRKEA